MTVIHPQDSTTDFLRKIYECGEGVVCYTGKESRKQMTSILYHLPKGETIMMLGHGTDKGLFRLEGGEYCCYIGRSMAHSLRQHPVIGIWCHANLFAEAEGLHGFFTGMFISEMREAREYGIETTQEELDVENDRFATLLRKAIDEGVPLGSLKEWLLWNAAPASPLTRFNYGALCYH